MKRSVCLCLCISFALGITLLVGSCREEPRVQLPSVADEAVNFIVANDLGRNGYYEQKPIAQLMGYTADNMSIEMIAAVGDIHHFEGVASVDDPLWMTNYELIYDHPDLMIDWNAVCGNHEYRGNTQAVLDYSRVSRRWYAPAYYYTRSLKSDDGATCLLVFINTTPLIDKYRRDTLDYPDACCQDPDVQLQWIDSVLTHSTEHWKIVIGHHPVYAATSKDDSEREDMQSRLAPILESHLVDAYFCGHIHNFQHIRPSSSAVHYVVNSSASLSRSVEATPSTLFCSGDAGFTICSAQSDAFTFTFINHKGKNIYTYSIRK